MKFKAVIFDLDGTLLNTLEDLANAANHVLREFGFPEHPTEAYRYFVGEGMINLAWRVLPEEQRHDSMINQIVARYRQIYHEHLVDRTCPYEGVPELLTDLSHRGISMAILSNKPHEVTTQVVERLLSAWHFAVVMGASPNHPLKPNPQSALTIAERLTVSPEDCLYLGDTRTDMETACRAKMFPVGALWGFRTAKELLASGARALVQRPLELLTILTQ
jgi:phosphoglycolate phosphatase